jgi:hypothetical protein
VVPAPFKTGIPIILLSLFKPAPGQTYTGTIFAVQIDQATILGQSLETIVNTADPSGRVDPSNAIPVRLTAVPEASAFTQTALRIPKGSRRESPAVWREPFSGEAPQGSRQLNQPLRRVAQV